MHFCEGRKEGRTQVRGMRGEGGERGRRGGQLSEVSGSPGVLQLCVLNVFTLISFLPPFCPPRSFSSFTSPTTCCIPSSVSLVSITLHFCHHFFSNALGGRNSNAFISFGFLLQHFNHKCSDKTGKWAAKRGVVRKEGFGGFVLRLK